MALADSRGFLLLLLLLLILLLLLYLLIFFFLLLLVIVLLFRSSDRKSSAAQGLDRMNSTLFPWKTRTQAAVGTRGQGLDSTEPGRAGRNKEWTAQNPSEHYIII